jgi:hypothetical protein
LFYLPAYGREEEGVRSVGSFRRFRKFRRFRGLKKTKPPKRSKPPKLFSILPFFFSLIRLLNPRHFQGLDDLGVADFSSSQADAVKDAEGNEGDHAGDDAHRAVEVLAAALEPEPGKCDYSGEDHDPKSELARLLVFVDGGVADSGIFLYDLLGALAGEKGWNGQQGEYNQCNQPNLVDLAVVENNASEKDACGKKGAQDGEVVQEKVKVCGIHLKEFMKFIRFMRFISYSLKNKPYKLYKPHKLF